MALASTSLNEWQSWSCGHGLLWRLALTNRRKVRSDIFPSSEPPIHLKSDVSIVALGYLFFVAGLTEPVMSDPIPLTLCHQPFGMYRASPGPKSAWEHCLA